MKRHTPLFFAIAVMMVCGAAAQNAANKSDKGWIAPEEEAARKNPIAGDADAVAGGQKLFVRKCAECHNEDGSGVQDAPDIRVPEVQKQSDGSLFWKITNGNVRKGMPPFSRLPETQRWQIVSFLRTLKPGPPAPSSNSPK